MNTKNLRKIINSLPSYEVVVRCCLPVWWSLKKLAIFDILKIFSHNYVMGWRGWKPFFWGINEIIVTKINGLPPSYCICYLSVAILSQIVNFWMEVVYSQWVEASTFSLTRINLQRYAKTELFFFCENICRLKFSWINIYHKDYPIFLLLTAELCQRKGALNYRYHGYGTSLECRWPCQKSCGKKIFISNTYFLMKWWH